MKVGNHAWPGTIAFKPRLPEAWYVAHSTVCDQDHGPLVFSDSFGSEGVGS